MPIVRALYNLPDEVAMEWAGWQDHVTFGHFAKMGRVEISKMMRRVLSLEALELDKKLQ